MRHWKKGLALAILAATCGCSDNRGTSGTGISDKEAAPKGDTGPESRDTGSATGAGGGSASAPAGTTGEASPSPR